jgi:hypothetical protein
VVASLGKTPGDIWTFFGESGAQKIEPEVFHHGFPTAVVRILQQAYTNDREYARSMAKALRSGAMVLAVKEERAGVAMLYEVLRDLGGHSFAYGDHLTFMPLESSGSAVGATRAETSQHRRRAS